MVAVLALAALLAAGCSQPTDVAGQSGDRLSPGVIVSADLDGDGATEEVLVDATTRRLTISDGAIVYQSRDKWRMIESYLGDTDRNGLLEVAALLEADDGRHLGLFAYVGGEYRERLVTSVLTPRPLSLRVLPDSSGASAGAGDLLVLTEEPAPGQTGVQTVTYRWNGFGFTAVP
ncbi:MAG: hypothetical protein V1912_04110 [bacterium]